MTRTMLAAGLALAFVVPTGCGNSEEAQQQAAQQVAQQMAQAMEKAAQTQQQAQQQVAQAQNQAAQAAAGAGGSNFGTVSLSPGFMPDPHKAQGTSGGNLQASTWNPACTGWVTQQPDHLLAAGGAFGTLRIMANAAQDVTLVVQKPDGTYVCDDDTEGTNPVVVVTGAPAGTYKVWIGSYEQGANSAYQIGFSELPNVMPSSLAN